MAQTTCFHARRSFPG